MKLRSLTIFFPCQNDGKILPYLIAKTYAVAPKVAREFEVVIVENGSTDDTPEVLAMLTRQYPDLKVKRFQKPLGYGGAIREGLMAATKEWVFYTDGDGQYDPGELVSLVARVKPGIDVVNGYKVSRADPWYRVAGGHFYNWWLQLIYQPPIKDVDCDFRLIRRAALLEITLTSRSALICLELVLKLASRGCHFAQAPVKHYPRLFGQSRFWQPAYLWQTAKEHLAFYREWLVKWKG